MRHSLNGRLNDRNETWFRERQSSEKWISTFDETKDFTPGTIWSACLDLMSLTKRFRLNFMRISSFLPYSMSNTTQAAMNKLS